ncbi:MAG: alpha/beta hydrolase [Clostridiales bacterium]|uniref:Acetyl esterase/lipase n=1 Tax=Harryflintia acetispora TaxID=1849041 RepID=A0A9X8Y8T5_9FIRM|nr:MULTISPECIES: alpha/beta hydrolase [Oscillospiraceae]PWM34344.1 MAG: alpha/beta hydrolase [Clostridiales bacterium]RGB66300.1 alpha/beta hydrolase [Harryflintia acetispora]TCL44152.1 acetyl esterase/lipase [Harryflintia acetispora]
MAINKAMRAALKALSYPDLDVKKNYKLERQVISATSLRVSKLSYRIWDHKVPCGDHEVPVRIFNPPNDPPRRRMLLFFHGGGWVTGNIDSYDRVCATMARLTSHIVVSVDYRLAPEYKFPAAPEDCYAVAREVFSDPSLLGVQPQDITLIGDSAGGNLSAVVSLMARASGEFSPKRQILFYPATYYDHSETSPFPSVRENGTDYLLTSKRVCDFIDLYMSDPKDLCNPYFAPLMAKDLSHQPDTLIITAEYDPLRDEGEAYGRRLREAGNEALIHRMPDALHGFLSLPPTFVQVRRSYVMVNHFLNGEALCE